MEKRQVRKIFGYIDRTDFYHELGEAPGGILVYASTEDALEHCACAQSCGVIKVEISYIEDALDGDGSGSISSLDLENKNPYYIEQENKRINHYRTQAEFHKKRSELLNELADRGLEA